MIIQVRKIVEILGKQKMEELVACASTSEIRFRKYISVPLRGKGYLVLALGLAKKRANLTNRIFILLSLPFPSNITKNNYNKQ